MKVEVRLFASLRERLPDALRGRATLELSAGASLQDLRVHREIDIDAIEGLDHENRQEGAEEERAQIRRDRNSTITLPDLDRRLALLRSQSNLRSRETDTFIAFPKSVCPFTSASDFADFPRSAGEPPEFQHDMLPLFLGHRPINDPRLVDDEGSTPQAEFIISVVSVL